MASSKEYLAYILEQLSGLEDIRYRAMMGEYILYYREKVIVGIYDDRFLIKNVTAARESMPEASMEKPYEGAKEMLLVENVEDKEFLTELFNSIYDELPTPKPKKKPWEIGYDSLKSGSCNTILNLKAGLELKKTVNRKVYFFLV